MSRFTERLEGARQQALETGMEQASALVEAMLGSNDQVFGDVPLSRGERIARVVDMAQRGVMDILQTMSPPTYRMLMDGYLADISASPLETK